MAIKGLFLILGAFRCRHHVGSRLRRCRRDRAGCPEQHPDSEEIIVSMWGPPAAPIFVCSGVRRSTVLQTGVSSDERVAHRTWAQQILLNSGEAVLIGAGVLTGFLSSGEAPVPPEFRQADAGRGRPRLSKRLKLNIHTTVLQ